MAAKEAVRLSAVAAAHAVEAPKPAPPPPAPPVPRSAVPAPAPAPVPPPTTKPTPALPQQASRRVADATLSRVPLRDEPAPAPSRPTAAERGAPADVAGFLPRLAAWLVDSVILLALNLIFMSPVLLIYFFRPELKSREGGSDWTLALIASLSSLVILAANFWYLVGGWAKSGRTPGKALLGLVIVRGDRRSGGGLGWRTAVVRGVGYMLGSACLMIGFLVVLFRKDRRAWHDLIADTWVVWNK